MGLASRFGKEKNLRRLMVLVGLLAAMMMLTASPGLAHQGGPHHGDKYWKNYYPNTYTPLTRKPPASAERMNRPR
jgi:hypothetical protein